MVNAVTSETFEAEVLKASGLVVVDFYADWCGPCKMMAPIIDSISEDYDDVKFVKLNVDYNQDLAMNYGVMSIPTFMFFKNGDAAKTIVGGTSRDAFEDILDELK